MVNALFIVLETESTTVKQDTANTTATNEGKYSVFKKFHKNICKLINL